jgi:pseudouridine-5'-phosphate glycosidase/pseudouridine kinase
MFQGDRLVISPEVVDALETGSKGVVCLETAIVTHGEYVQRGQRLDLNFLPLTDLRPPPVGMPHPHNLHTALSVESLIRSTSSSVVPATIAILDSRIHVGLSPSQLEYLADPTTDSNKVSRRDLPRLLTPRWTEDGGRTGWNGGTTVAGTMYIAQSVGIDVFVTGGIGGVHRGAQQSEFVYMLKPIYSWMRAMWRRIQAWTSRRIYTNYPRLQWESFALEQRASSISV